MSTDLVVVSLVYTCVWRTRSRLSMWCRFVPQARKGKGKNNDIGLKKQWGKTEFLQLIFLKLENYSESLQAGERKNRLQALED